MQTGNGRAPLEDYEREGIAKNWLHTYEVAKERQFVRCLDRFIPEGLVTLLDIGCGPGLHTYLWSQQGKHVAASDFSTKFRDHIIRTYTFPFIWNDVLNCTIRGPYDVCFCMAISTILHDEEQRFRTFEALAGLVRAGSFLVLVTGSNQWAFNPLSRRVPRHSIDNRDIGKLNDLGFSLERVFYWSCSPRFLWRAPPLRWMGALVEAIGSALGIGARKVVICRRGAAATTLASKTPPESRKNE
jgi:hypothetical protein